MLPISLRKKSNSAPGSTMALHLWPIIPSNFITCCCSGPSSQAVFQIVRYIFLASKTMQLTILLPGWLVPSRSLSFRPQLRGELLRELEQAFSDHLTERLLGGVGGFRVRAVALSQVALVSRELCPCELDGPGQVSTTCLTCLLFSGGQWDFPEGSCEA